MFDGTQSQYTDILININIRKNISNKKSKNFQNLRTQLTKIIYFKLQRKISQKYSILIRRDFKYLKKLQ